MENNGKNVAFYIRTAASSQDSENMKVESCKKVAQKTLGKDITWAVFVDREVSGRKRAEHPGLTRMMAGVNNGDFLAVVTSSATRLSRNIDDAMKIVADITHAGIRFLSVTEGDYSSPNSRLAFNILEALAEYEREVRLEA